MNIIEQFITDNKLDFSGSGSELNSNCCALAGFALFKGLNLVELTTMFDEFVDNNEASDELVRLYHYAKKKDYGAKWKAGDYKGTYIY